MSHSATFACECIVRVDFPCLPLQSPVIRGVSTGKEQRADSACSSISAVDGGERFKDTVFLTIKNLLLNTRGTCTPKKKATACLMHLWLQ